VTNRRGHRSFLPRANSASRECDGGAESIREGAAALVVTESSPGRD
jgi:hypothetical protein